MGFWYRFSFNFPEPVVLSKMRSEPVGIATISETGFCYANYHNRKLGVNFREFVVGSPAFAFTSYSLSQELPDYSSIMELEDSSDFEGSWNYVFFSHSKELKKLFAYVFYSRSGKRQSLNMEDAEHKYPPERLIF